jgi:hypothetical protein
MNNPSLLVLNEVARVHRSRGAIKYCLSIGTGVTPSSLSSKPRNRRLIQHTGRKRQCRRGPICEVAQVGCIGSGT